MLFSEKKNILQADAWLFFRTYGHSAIQTAWRSKIVLDYAFLFSYSKGISPYFLNFEDDVEPVQNFVDQILDFIQGFDKKKLPWNSLLFSSYLSVGRLWRDETLNDLVQLFLTSHKSQPLDFLMQYLDIVQLVSRFGQDGSPFRRKPPLFHHIGEVQIDQVHYNQISAVGNVSFQYYQRCLNTPN